jgi:oligosaccharide repeat unit polymerase
MAQAVLAPVSRPSPVVVRQQEFPSYPFLGIFCVSVGTVLAQMFVPTAFHLPWAMFPSALCMTVGVLIPVVAAAIRNFRSILRAEHVMMFAIIYWALLDLLQGINNPKGVKHESVTGALACLGLLAGGIWAGSAVRRLPLPAVIRNAGSASLSPEQVFGLVLFCFALGIAHYLISCGFDLELLVQSLGAPRFAAPWQMGRLGDWRTFQYHMTYFGQVVPTLTVVLAHQIGWQRGRTMVAVICTVIMLAFLSSSGSRLEVGSVLGAAIATWLLLQPRITRRLTIGFTATLLVTLVWLQIMVTIRNQGLTRLLAGDEFQANFSHLIVDDNFYRLTQVLDVMPESYPHTYGGQIYYVMVRPIPRVFWPEKPINSGFDFEAAIGIPGDWVGLSYTVAGEFYLDFGMPTVALGGFIYGLFAAMWNRLLVEGRGPARPLVYGLGLLAMFGGIRSQQIFMIKSFTVVAFLVVHMLFVHGWTRSQGRPPLPSPAA